MRDFSNGSPVLTSDPVAKVEVVRDLVYASFGGRDLLLDLYLPRNAPAPRAVILWLHGGGWRIGDRRLAPDLTCYYAERGYVMASIDYRLSREAVFPAAVEDIKAAVRWLKAAAGGYDVDPNRIGLWGSSAGGHLAALVAASGPGQFEASEHLEQSSSVAAVVDAYGPTDFLQMDSHRDPEGKPSDDPESIQLPPGKLSADADSLESLFLGLPIQTCPERVRAANPIAYVTSGLPPFLLLHGTSDTAVPVHQSMLLYEALERSGNQATLCLIKGLGHGFLTRKNLDQVPREMEVQSCGHGSTRFARVRTRALEFIGDWFDQYLGQERQGISSGTAF